MSVLSCSDPFAKLLWWLLQWLHPSCAAHISPTPAELSPSPSPAVLPPKQAATSAHHQPVQPRADQEPPRFPAAAQDFRAAGGETQHHTLHRDKPYWRSRAGAALTVRYRTVRLWPLPALRTPA